MRYGLILYLRYHLFGRGITPLERIQSTYSKPRRQGVHLLNGSGIVIVVPSITVEIMKFPIIRGAFNKFPDFFVKAFKIVVDS